MASPAHYLMDSRLSYSHRSGRRLDERLVDSEWRKDRSARYSGSPRSIAPRVFRLPQVEIEVPAYELPLPEGVGQEQGEGETLSMREIEETWKEKLIDSHTDSTSH